MTSHNRWRADHRFIASAVLVAAIGYALAMVAVKLLAGNAYMGDGALLERSADLLCLGGLSLTILQLRANWRDAQGRARWLLVAGAMSLLTFSEAREWISLAGRYWDANDPYKLPLWIAAAVALYLCTRPGRAQIWVRRSVLAGFTAQSLSILLDIRDGESLIPAFVSTESWEFLTDLTELLSLECYVAALVFSFLSPLRAGEAAARAGRWDRPHLAFVDVGVAAPRAAAPVAVGALARTLYHDLRLFRAARYPTRYPILHRPGVRQFVTLVMVAMFGARIAPRVFRAGGKPVLRQFLELLDLGLRQGIDAVSYYLLDLYRPGGRAEAAYYLTRYETKNGLFTVLNAMRPRRDDVPYNMTDKVVFGDALHAAGIPTPPILLTIEDGTVTWHRERASLDQDLFVKLKRGRGTMRTGRFRRVAPYRYLDREGREVGLNDIVERFRQQSLTVVGHKTTPFIVQPLLRNHPDVADLADDSLIVVRVVTCLNRDDKPEVTHAMLRILSKIEPDWDTAPDWEYGAAIDLDTGRLGRLTGDKPDSCLRWYDAHPITGAPVLGRVLTDWPALRDLALSGHRVFRDRVIIGWDLALTDNGPLVLEGNSNLDVSFIQRAYRHSIGRSRLGELLDYHLSALRKR